MNNRLKLSAFVVGIALAIAGSFGWAHAQLSDVAPASSILVQSGATVNIYQAAPLPVSVEAPALGAMSLDLASSDLLNVNGFNQYVLVGLLGNGYNRATTTVYFTDPFKAPTTTAADVVIDSVTAGFGYTGVTSTVTLVEISAGNTVTTTAFEFDCTASANQGSTSTPAIINSESPLGASNPFVIRSGMTSSTNPGAGSYVQDPATNSAYLQTTTQILLTPRKPYLVCKVWHSTGGALTSFTDSAGTAAVKVTAFISRMR